MISIGIGIQYTKQLFRAIVSAFMARVSTDGGTIEAIQCLNQYATKYADYIALATLVETANAYKSGKIYSLVPTNGNGDLTVTRATSATRMNAAGEIETVGSGVLRLNYPNAGGCPYILLEPQRTNLFLNSLSLSTQSVTVTATKYYVSFRGTGTITFSGAYTGTLVGTGAMTLVSTNFTPSAGTLTCTVSGTVSYAQIEAGTCYTSWIPTTGSTATRNMDLLSLSSTTGIANSEGTIFTRVYFDGRYATGGNIPIMIHNGSANDAVYIYLYENGQVLFRSVKAGNVEVQITTSSGYLTANTWYSLAFRYKSGDFAAYINGTQIGTASTGLIPTISQIWQNKLDGTNGYNFNLINSTIISTTALNNTQLAALTAL